MLHPLKGPSIFILASVLTSTALKPGQDGATRSRARSIRFVDIAQTGHPDAELKTDVNFTKRPSLVSLFPPDSPRVFFFNRSG